MNGTRIRYEALVGPDGRILALVEHTPKGLSRPIQAEVPEGLAVLVNGRDILYRFDDERSLRDLPYVGVLEAMRQELHVTIHKLRHGELLDEPELVPVLRRLLADLEATAASFQQACKGIPAEG